MYVYKGGVSAYGSMDANKNLEVSVSDTVIYTNLDVPDVQVAGVVEFGEDNKEVWTAEQVKASNEILDSTSVTVSVDKKDLEYSGVYTSEIIFNIDLVDSIQ